MGSSTAALSTLFFGFACGCTGGGIACSVMNHAGAAFIFSILNFIFVIFGVIFLIPGIRGDNAPKGVLIVALLLSISASITLVFFIIS